MTLTTPDMTSLDQRIAQLLAEIPEEERRQFEAYYQTRLAIALQQANMGGTDNPLGAADPDEVEARLVEQLIRESEGRDDADGQGLVPTEEEEYFLNIPDHDPRVNGPARRPATKAGARAGAQEMTPARWAGVAAVLLVVIVGIAMSLFGGSEAEVQAEEQPGTTVEATTEGVARTATPRLTTPTPLAAMGSSGEVTVAYPTSLEIDSSIFRVLATEGELGGAWEPEPERGTAAWLAGSYINAVFCLPADAKGMMSELQRGAEIIMRPASGAVRHYEVIRNRTVGRQQTEVMDQRRAGLTLILCGGEGNDRQIVEAIYRDETPVEASANQGGELEIPGVARMALQGAEVVTTTEQLPAGLVAADLKVVVTNLADAPLAWADLADQLIIDGGAVENISRPADLDAGETVTGTFRYLVPREGATATWRWTAITGETISFNLAIPPAPASMIRPVLTGQLSGENVLVQDSPEGRSSVRQLHITINLSATGSEVVDLQPADVSVWAGSRTIALGAGSTPLPALIQPGETRPLTLVVEVPDIAVIEVHVKGQRWRVTLP